MRLFAQIALAFTLAGMAAAIAGCDGAVHSQASAPHFSTLPPHAALPSGHACAAVIPQSSETVSANIPFNHTMPSPTMLADFYVHPAFGSNPPAADFIRVDGRYTGSTDMILRWAACNWGFVEDVFRAQAWTESKWRQGGPLPGDGGGDRRFLKSQCIQGEFTALWGYGCPNCCYQSWGILQTKVCITQASGTAPIRCPTSARSKDISEPARGSEPIAGISAILSARSADSPRQGWRKRVALNRRREICRRAAPCRLRSGNHRDLRTGT
jgi:hypothetical protein